VQRVRQWAEENNPVVQLMLPMVEILTLAKRGAGELVREAGLRLMLLAIQQEAEALTGARYQCTADRQAHRWSQEDCASNDNLAASGCIKWQCRITQVLAPHRWTCGPSASFGSINWQQVQNGSKTWQRVQ